MALLVAALLLLLLLASLQYYWVGQVSVGERERAQASLRAGATRFSDDFDRELARIYLSLQMDAATLRDQAWEDYTRRYDHWFAKAPYPRLVSDIYLVEMYENGRLYLAHYDKQSKRFVTESWPETLAGLRLRFEQAAKTIRTEGGLMVSEVPAPIVEDLPALVIPLSRMALLADRENYELDADFFIGDTVLSTPRRTCPYCPNNPSNAGPVFGYTVALLDRAYLQQEFIPALARHYFASDRGLDYNFTIASRVDPQQVFYESNPRQAEVVPSAADVRAGLLSVRMDEFNRLLLDDTILLGNGAPGEDRRSYRILSTIPADAPTPRPEDANLVGAPDGRWQLMLTHRAGSLDTAITRLRLRDMLISFSILLLLAASMAMLMLSTRRAQRLAQQKMEFVAAISHELRTPLAVIRSAGENLADGVVLDPQRAKQYGVLIHNEGRRLTEMVEQALEFAGGRPDLQSYDLRPVELGDLIERALRDCEARLREGDFHVEQDIDPDLPQLMADAQSLRRAILNLLNNAIKYSGEQRWIKVRARWFPSRRGPEIRISVQDRGIGIAPDDLPHIFDPFYRGRSVAVSDIHGTGLGLNLVKQIAEAHGGRVSVESTFGQGSTFTLHLYGQPGDERARRTLGSFGNP
jgi:signal transduction histidine kinase